MTDDLFPYKKDTPQVKGRKAEKPMAKRYDAKVHPNSGAGRIKNDASNDEDDFEFKLANRSHTITSAELHKLYSDAARKGRGAMYVIEFTNGMVLEGRVLNR